MKKTVSILLVVIFLTLILSVTVFANQNEQMTSLSPEIQTVNANNVNGDSTGNTASTQNTNYYRTNAATDGNNNDWGWLGLLGLLGLVGMRSRKRERT